MDINSILPLLLGKGDGADKSKLFSMLAGGGGSPEDMMSKMAGPEMSGLMNMLKNNKKTRTQEATGLSAIIAFAPAEIIGTLVKLLDAV